MSRTASVKDVTFAEVHDEVRACCVVQSQSGCSGPAEHVQGAVADLECEQHVEPPQRHRALHVAGDVVVDLGLQRFPQQPPGTLPHELVDQGHATRSAGSSASAATGKP
jgi:hypothetical protein